MKFSIKDEPVNLEKFDLFKTKDKAREIEKYIKDNWEELKHNNSIAIKGPWGSGKSSVIATWVENKSFEVDDFELFIIDAWKYEGDLDLKTSIIQEIYFNANKEILEKVLMAVAKYTIGLKEKLVEKIGNKVGVEKIAESSKYHEFKEINTYISELIKTSKFSKKVVVIDNVDRLSPANLVLFLNSIKYLFSAFKEFGVVFVLLVDEKYMMHSFVQYLKLDEQKAAEFTSKLFARTFEIIPRINLNEFKNIDLSNLLKVKKMFNNNPRNINKFFALYDHIFGLNELKSFSAEIDYKIYLLAMKLLFPMDAIKIFEPEINWIELRTNISFNYIDDHGTTHSKRLDRSVYVTSKKGGFIGGDNKVLSYVLPAPDSNVTFINEPHNIVDLIEGNSKNYVTRIFLQDFNFELKIERMDEILDEIIRKI